MTVCFVYFLVIDHPQIRTSGEVVRAGGMDRPAHTKSHPAGHYHPASQVGRRVEPAL
jgi:hypothetical protein